MDTIEQQSAESIFIADEDTSQWLDNIYSHSKSQVEKLLNDFSYLVFVVQIISS